MVVEQVHIIVYDISADERPCSVMQNDLFAFRIVFIDVAKTVIDRFIAGVSAAGALQAVLFGNIAALVLLFVDDNQNFIEFFCLLIGLDNVCDALFARNLQVLLFLRAAQACADSAGQNDADVPNIHRKMLLSVVICFLTEAVFNRMVRSVQTPRLMTALHDIQTLL